MFRYKDQTFVEVLPTFINFGRVDLGSRLVGKKLTIKNSSSCATKFLVHLGDNELVLGVSPQKGWMRPYSSITLQLELVALKVGEFSSDIW